MILNNFDQERHIQIETGVSSYAISGIISQLTSDDLARWYLITFFSQQIVPAEIQYETNIGELLAIVKTFKTWKHYLEGYKHVVLVLTNHNNLQHFMNTKTWALDKFLGPKSC